MIGAIINIREDAENEFKLIFKEAQRSADLIGNTITRKRITTKQTNQANPQHLTFDEQYFRETIFLSFLDNFISEFNDRFLNHKNVLKGFECLFQSTFSDKDRKEIQHLVDLYSPTIDKNNIIAELKMWKLKLATNVLLTKNGLETLDNYDEEIYPNIHILLKIFVSLPVATATPERSFSSLKHLKTYLRNTMTETRLNGLSLLSIHRDIPLSVEEVINELATQSRKLDFVL